MAGFRLYCTFIFLVVLFIFGDGTSAFSDIYCYTDENGVRHFSNTRRDTRYRAFLRPRSKKHPLNKINKTKTKRYNDIIHLAAEKFQVDKSLIKAVIKAESDFDHRAVSCKGAQGLMQLMPETAQRLKITDPFDPKENVLGGTRYLSLLLKRFDDDKTLALAAYNAGPEVVESHRSVPPYKETTTFVKRVLAYYQAYNQESQ